MDPVELARRTFAAINARDAAAFCEICQPDVECVSLLSTIEGGTYSGYEGIRRWFDDMQAFGFLRMESREAPDPGEGGFRQRGTSWFHAPASGIDVRNAWVAVVESRDGLVTRFRVELDDDAGSNPSVTP